MQIVTDHPDVFVYLVLVVIEQAFLLAPGSWPYRYGVPVFFKPLGLSFEKVKDRLAELPVRLHYDVDVARKEIFFRNVFPLWTWGPLLFIGQAQFKRSGRIIIRMAPLTSLGVIYLFLDAIGTFRLLSIVNGLILALILAGYYRWLVTKLKFLL